MSDGIVAKGVTKKFGSNVVLDDLCVTMESGLIHGLLGNNGVGKSVLLKCICALLPIDAGIISVNGQHMKVGKPAVPTLGVVMEQTNFIPNLSGYKNLTYLITGKRRCGNELAKQAMEMVGLNAKSKIPVSQYSLGMRQCLAIAQAIMEEPEVLILDQPFNGLDYHAFENVKLLIQALKKRGTTVLLTSHKESDIYDLCDTIYILERGMLKCRSCDRGGRQL